jgi:hypothetical protein
MRRDLWHSNAARKGATIWAEVNHMTKSLVTKTWISGLIVFTAGILVAIVGVFLMLAYGGTFSQVSTNPNNYDFTPNIDGFFWTTVMLIVVGGIVALAGSIVQFVAWIGGMVNSYRLPDKTWFAVLLIGGVLAFAFAPIGFAAMLAYVIAAPEAEHVPAMPAPRLAPTS